MASVVVTGAAHGIGRAVAESLADAGHGVAVVDRDSEALAVLGTELRARGAPRVAETCVDLADAGAAEEALDDLGAHLDADGEDVIGVVSAAGIGGWNRVQDVTRVQWDAIMDVNLRAAFLLTRAFADRLAAAGGAGLVYLGSDACERGFGRRAAYCASKHGLAGLAAAVREELRDAGVRVTLLLFSRVDTAFNGGIAGSRPDALQPDQVAGVVRWVLEQPAGVEIRELKLSAPTSPYGA